jgi:hypothetical protein
MNAMDPQKKEIWEFLNRELAKLKTITEISNSLFENVELANNAYNQFFQLILDSFTRQVAVSIYCFFDKKHSWSLYQFSECISENEIKKVENAAKEIVELRHERVAHLTRKKTVKHNSNFSFLSDQGVKLLNELIEEIHQLLHKVSTHYHLGSSWAMQYPDIKSSYELLIEALKAQEEIDKTVS